MKYVYPALFVRLENGQYGVKVPALPGCVTEGQDLVDAIEMVRDAAAMWLCMAEDSHETIPEPQVFTTSNLGQGELISWVDIDTVEYRVANDNRSVKKTLTLPSWLNAKAESEDINFSQLLQSALKEKLGLMDKKGA
jgi:antitoxin HicB